MSDPFVPGHSELTTLLREASRGNGDAFSRLVTLVYRELSQLAHLRLSREQTGHTLDTAGLVHEAYLKLIGQTRASWQDREHFFAVASEAMRRILVDHARRRLRGKRAGPHHHVPLDDAIDGELAVTLDEPQSEELLALDAALQRLAAFNPEGARIVQLRFFGGLSNDDIATMTGSSERTVRRQWSAAKAWLRRELAAVVHGPSSLGSLTGE